MTKDLKVFGEKLKSLRIMSGWSQQDLAEHLNTIHIRVQAEILPIVPNLISKWETAYTHKGRQWSPSREIMLYLIEVFADHLNVEEAINWAKQAGHFIIDRELTRFFPIDLDWPPIQCPQPPTHFVQRQELETLITKKIEQENRRSIVLWGPGGVGKTTLATQLTQFLTDRFPDGIIWIPVQVDDTVHYIQDTIADSLGITLDGNSLAKRARKLHSRLRKKQCLLVFDDIWEIPDLIHLRLDSETCQTLYTTRDAKVAEILETTLIPIQGLTEPESSTLLTKWAGYEVEAKALITRLGGLPLALRLAGALLQAGLSITELLTAIEEEHANLNLLDLNDPQTRLESLTLCFDITYQQLSTTTQIRFLQLGHFINTSLDKTAVSVVWGTNKWETFITLRELGRFALLEQKDQGLEIHALLLDYARQKLPLDPTDHFAAGRCHAIWHIRQALSHPSINNQTMNVNVDFDQKWADIVAGVKWAVHYDPKLASQAALLAYTERPALSEEIGMPLVESVEAYLPDVSDDIEQVILYELLGDLNLLQSNLPASLSHFEQASHLWQSLENEIARSRTKLRMAGVHLLSQNLETAAKVANQAQNILKQALPIPDTQRAVLDRLFYWFNMIYNPLIRWEGLPEADVISLVHLADQINDPIIRARGLHIHRLWCTTNAVARSQSNREKGRQLALEAYQSWQMGGRTDRADDEISLTKYLLTNAYSRRTAIRFARRRSQTTPTINSPQTNIRQNKGVSWWLAADEAQRVRWLSWMLPRYLAADNRPLHPAKDTPLSVLTPDSTAYKVVDNILSIGALGNEVRRVTRKIQPPSNHHLNGAEWRVLSGQKVLPIVENEMQVVERYLGILVAEMEKLF